MATEGFKRTLIAAVGWSAAMKIGFQLVSWVMTLAVIRVLSPDDYGLMAISQVFTSFILVFSSLGLGDAIVQRTDLPPSLLANAFGVLILMALALAVSLSLAAYPIAGWYGDARLVPLVQVSSLGFLFNAFSILPRTLLAKQMRVRPIFVAELSAGLIGAALTTILAFTGHGVWSLALGALAGNVARQAAFAWLAADLYVWPRFNVAAVRPLLGFGAYSTLEWLAFTVMTSADVLIVGRLLGPADVGAYTVVLNFAAMPINKIAPIINSIAFPAFAMVQGNPDEARYYVLKGLRLFAVLVVPVFFGMGVTAPEVVNLVFGPAWAAARPLLPILSGALTFRALLILVPNYLQGTGDAKAAFWCTAAGAVTFPLAVLVGCRWGLAGACWAWLACYPAVFAAEALIAARRGGFSFRAVALSPARPLTAGLVMVLAVFALRQLLPDALPDAARLLLLAGAGAVVYALTIVAAFPDLARELLNVVRPAKRTA